MVATPEARHERDRRGPSNPVARDANGLRTIPKLGNGSSSNDPPEHVGRGEVPTVDADGNVRGQKVRSMIGRNGQPAPGGFSAITGKPRRLHSPGNASAPS